MSIKDVASSVKPVARNQRAKGGSTNVSDFQKAFLQARKGYMDGVAPDVFMYKGTMYSVRQAGENALPRPEGRVGLPTPPAPLIEADVPTPPTRPIDLGYQPAPWPEQSAPWPTGGGSPDQKSASGAIDDYAAAIKKIESSGNYRALGPVTKTGDRAYGAYQVMGANIPQWTEQVLGKAMTPQEFLASPEAQDAVFHHQFSQAMDKYGTADDAASVWFSGRPMHKAGNVADVTGTTVPQYVQNFRNALGQVKPAQPTMADVSNPKPATPFTMAPNASDADIAAMEQDIKNRQEQAHPTNTFKMQPNATDADIAAMDKDIQERQQGKGAQAIMDTQGFADGGLVAKALSRFGAQMPASMPPNIGILAGRRR